MLAHKIIVVMNATKAKIFEAQGLRILTTIKELEYEDSALKHKRQEKHEGFYHHMSLPSHFFDPRSDSKDLEREAFAKTVATHIEEIILKDPNRYGSLILVADPKILGKLHASLKSRSKSILIKQISKDLINYNEEKIQNAVFA